MFSLKLSSRANQKKKKRTWVQEYLNIEKNKEFTIIYSRRCVSMIENRIASYLYNELFSEINEGKYTAFQRMAWSLIVHKNPIKNCSTALQTFSFRSLSLYPLFPFNKARILLRFLSQAFSILNMFS